MNKYTTLEIVLNKCIEKWRKPFWRSVFYRSSYLEGSDMVIYYTLRSKWQPWDMWYRFSINDLFSVDSWLMEFVEWKWVDHEWCRNPVEERWGGIWWYLYYWLSTDSYKRKKFNLLEMSDMKKILMLKLNLIHKDKGISGLLSQKLKPHRCEQLKQ